MAEEKENVCRILRQLETASNKIDSLAEELGKQDIRRVTVFLTNILKSANETEANTITALLDLECD